jgi:hypothetical protein
MLFTKEEYCYETWIIYYFESKSYEHYIIWSEDVFPQRSVFVIFCSIMSKTSYMLPQVTIYNLHVTSYNLHVTSYNLQFKSYNLQVETSFVLSCQRHRTRSPKLQFTIYKLQFTSRIIFCSIMSKTSYTLPQVTIYKLQFSSRIIFCSIMSKTSYTLPQVYLLPMCKKQINKNWSYL